MYSKSSKANLTKMVHFKNFFAFVNVFSNNAKRSFSNGNKWSYSDGTLN